MVVGGCCPENSLSQQYKRMENPVLARVFNNADWAAKGILSTRIDVAWHTLAPLARFLIAAVITYLAVGLVRKKPRLNSALVTATTSAFLTYAYLFPMMIHGQHGNGGNGAHTEISHVALAVLSVYAASIGAALGSLLPRPLGGVTLGCGLAIMLVVILPKKKAMNGFLFWGPILSVVGGVLATR